jgi:hypothetical protein
MAPVAQKAEVSRLRDSARFGLHVHIDRPDYWTYHWACSAGITRVLDTFDPDVDFLLITNRRAFTETPAQLRAFAGTDHILAYWLIAHWTERNAFGEVEDSLEYSWLCVKDDAGVPAEKWLAAARELADHYDQSSFIVRLDGEITQRKRDSTIECTLSDVRAMEDAWANLAKLRAQASPDHVIGDGREFEPAFFLKEPDNNSAKRSFQAIGAQYIRTTYPR